jgi:hypothetical protein
MPDAETLVNDAAERLWRPEGTKALAYLNNRGLDDATIKAARLGWTPGVMVPYGDGDQCYRTQGVCIPWFDGSRLTRVKIRDPDAPQARRYKEVFSYRPAIYPSPEVIRPGRPLIIAEGELDRLLLDQILGDLAGVVTLGSASARPDAQVLGLMMTATPWYIALDADVAGDKAVGAWPPTAIRVRPPEGNDWTDIHAGGVNRIRYFWGRYLPMSLAWETLESQRWGQPLESEDR